MWDKFIRCSNSLALNISLTKTGSSWCAKQSPPPSKASSSLPMFFTWPLAVDVEEPRSWENSYFTPWGTSCLSWLHTGTSMPSIQTLTMWGKLEALRSWSHKPRPNVCQGAAEVVIRWRQGQSHQVSKRNFAILGKITHINKLSDQ